MNDQSKEGPRPAWERHDTPRWFWEVKVDGEPASIASGDVDDTGLNVLDKIVSRIPDLIYNAETEPHTLTIELTTVPF